MTQIKRINGWQTTDNKVWNTEDYAIDHQRYLNVRDGILKMASEATYGSNNVCRAIAAHLAERRNELYLILKDNT